MYNGNELSIIATPTITVEFGDTTYSAADVGTITGLIDFRKMAPYVGFGLASRGRVGIMFDLGVILQGSPQVAYDATTTLTGTALTAFNNAVADQAVVIEGEIPSFFKYYPVLGLGLRIKLK